MIRKYFRTETRTVTDRFEVKQEVICDTCKKVIGKWDGFFQVRTGHDRWGIDSIESRETHHFCCKRCMDAFLDDYWKEPENTDSADIEFVVNQNRASHSPDDSVQEVFEEEDT